MEGCALAQAWPLVRVRVLAAAAPLSKLLDSGALDSGLLDSVLTVLASAGKGDA
jgi:hypothetical protein